MQVQMQILLFLTPSNANASANTFNFAQMQVQMQILVKSISNTFKYFPNTFCSTWINDNNMADNATDMIN